MCITHINVHACGHTSYIDTSVCRAHLRALGIAAYMESPYAERQASPLGVEEHVLLAALAEWRRKCIEVSRERGRYRNYKCAECLGEMLKRTGLAETEEGDGGELVARIGRTGF